MEPIRAYLRDISKVERLSTEEEGKLSRRAKRGDQEARRRMIHANLPLVISMAKKYSYLGMPLIDLIEEGNIGLMRALAKFNPSRGYRFSTYAAWWIRQYITRAIANQSRVVRVPVYMNEMFNKWRKVVEKLSHKSGRKPTDKEIAREMNITVSKVKEITELTAKTSSLDASVAEESSTDFVDLLEDTSSRNATDELVNRFHHEKVAELLGLMSEREREILNMRFGFVEGISHSLSEIAKKFDISRERVRQIEEVALNKLKKLLSSPGAARSFKARKINMEEKNREEELEKVKRMKRRKIFRKFSRKVKASKKNKFISGRKIRRAKLHKKTRKMPKVKKAIKAKKGKISGRKR